MTQQLDVLTDTSGGAHDQTQRLAHSQPGTDGRKLWQKRRVLLPVTALVAFMIGASAGGSDLAPATQQAPQTSAAIEQLENQVKEADARADEAIAAREQVESQLAQQRQELDARSAALDQREAAIAQSENRLDTTPAAKGTTADAPQPAPKSSGCDPNYSPCIPAYPPDLDCGDIGHRVTVTGSDPHGLDGDGDGVGCDGS